MTKNYEIERACAELETEVERLKQQHQQNDERWLVQEILCYMYKTLHFLRFFVCLALWEGKMSRILHCDWLPKRARWRYLAPAGFPVMSCKTIVYLFNTINPSLTKRGVKMAVYWPRSFVLVYGPRLLLSFHKYAKREDWLWLANCYWIAGHYLP